MVDKHTERKMGLNFASLLVEVKVGVEFLDELIFKNEKDNMLPKG